MNKRQRFQQLSAIGVIALMSMVASLGQAGQFEDLGIPVRKAGLMNTIIGPDKSGTKDLVYMNFMQQAAPVFLLAVDPDTGETRQYGAERDNCNWASCLGPDGKIYVGTVGAALILCFDPKQPELGLKTIGRPSESESYIWQLCVGKKDQKIYGCTYGNAKLVSYDPKTGKLEDLGRMDDTQDYTRTVASGPTGKIYTGIGMVKQNLVVYDPATGTYKSLLDDKQRVPGCVSVEEGTDGNVYTSIGGDGGGAFRIDDETLTRVPAIPHKSLVLRDGRAIANLTTGNAGGQFTVVDPKTNEQRAVKFQYEGAGSGVFVVGVGPEGCIYGSTAMPLEVFRHDPKANTSEHLGNMPGGEVYSMIDYHGLLYLCYYGGSIMNLYDPKNPVWKYGTEPGSNPRSFGGMGDGHLRPRAMIYGPDEMIYVGSHPPYGQVGGAMGVWDPKQNKTVENYRNLIQDQSIVAIAYEPKSGLIFGGSGNYGGGGTRPTQKEALFFAFDPVKKQKVYETALVPGAQTYQAMAAAEGKVFLALDQLYVYDPEKKEVVHKAALPGGAQLEISLGLYSDGLIYGLTTQCVYSVNPKTCEIKEVAKAPVPIGCGFAMTDTGIYFGSGVHLWGYKWK